MFNKILKLPFAKKKTIKPAEIQKEQIDVTEAKTANENHIPTSGHVLIQQVKDALHNPADLIVKTISPNLTLIYIDDLVDNRPLNDQILRDLLKSTHESPEKIKELLSIPKVDLSNHLDKSILALLNRTVHT